MSRHRGTYKPELSEPYELSRGKLESSLNCEACFWLDRVGGVKFPSIPGFLLNTNTDTLLKKDFDKYRGVSAHPLMALFGLSKLRPFNHPNIDKWVNALQFGASPNHFNTIHEKTNILLGGGIDDVWENSETGELHVVDYKSTAQMSSNPAPLDESFILPPQDLQKVDYKAGYRRQIEMYQWILRRRGYVVSNIGYFVYVDGQHINESGMLDEQDPSQAWMRFKAAVIPYLGDDSWVEDAIINAKKILSGKKCPAHSSTCEHGEFLKQADKFRDG